MTIRSRHFRCASLIGISALILSLLACGASQENGGYGAITAHAVWVTSIPAANEAARIFPAAPAGTANVRMSVSASDMTTVTQTFPAAAGQGTVNGIPAGTGRTLTMQGLDSSNNVIYQGTVNNITVSANNTADAGTVTMLPTQPRTIGGTVSGLSGGTLVLQNNGGDNKTITANGSFTFPSAIQNGMTYSVTVLTQPAGQTCTVANASGTVAGTVSNVNVTCAALDLNQGLVAYYPFSGNANDASGNGNNGIVTGATLTTDRFGNANSAYRFAGDSSTYIQVPASSLLEPQNGISISFWMMKKGAGYGDQRIFRKESNCGPGYSIYNFVGAEIGGINVCSGDSVKIFNDVSPSLDQWNHYVMTYDVSTGMKIFKNAQMIATGGTLGATMSHSGDLYMGGATVHPNDGGLNGALDDVRIYNRALNTAEVEALYNLPYADQVVFVSNRTGKSQIYKMNTDGTNQVQITNESVDCYKPALSPDGQKVSFSRNSVDLYVVNIDGTGLTKVTNVSSAVIGYVQDSIWDHTGTKIYFAGRSGGYDEVWVVNADGTNQQKILSISGRDLFPLSFSSDGSKLSLHDNQGYADGSDNVQSVVNIDGTGYIKAAMATGPRDDWGHWNPVGNSFMYTKGRGAGPCQIYIENSTGSDYPGTNISNDTNNYYWPIWSVDGSKIYFQSEQGGGGYQHIWVMNADGSGKSQLTTGAYHDSLR